MIDLEQRIRQLSPRKRALLAERLKPYGEAAARQSPALASTRLVGYVVLHDDAEVSGSQLREFLSSILPDYMIPSAFVLLDALPRTPNGKLDRLALPRPDTDARQPGEEFTAPRNTLEQEIAAIWADTLGLESVGVYDNFFEIGGDSILSIQIVARARQRNIHFTPAQLFQYQTVAELAVVVGTASVIAMEQESVISQAALTPIQSWFFEQNFADFHHWNQALLLETPADLDIDTLERAGQALVDHHDALRLRFGHEESGWQQRLPDTVIPLHIERVDLAQLDPRDQTRILESSAASVQASLDPLDGRLVRMIWFDRGAGQSARLLLVIHHLAVDTVSWQILLEDLETAYKQIQQGKAVDLPRKTTSYLDWAQRLNAYARDNAAARDVEYWLTQYPAEIKPIPVVAKDSGANTEDTTEIVTLDLGVDETKVLLAEIPAVYNMQIHEALLTALVRAFWRWTKQTALLVGLENHGRHDIVPEIDLSRTVGWFTSFFPVLLATNGEANPDGDLKAVKERIRTLPQKGLSYGLLRYTSADQAVKHELQSRPQPEILFNYVGQVDHMLDRFSLFKLASESTGPAHSPRAHRHHVLEINAMIRADRLQLQWMYSRHLHDAETIRRLAHWFEDAVREIVDASRSGTGGGYTPSDFPEAELNQSELDDLLAELDD